MRNKLAQKSNHFVNILLKRVTYQKIEKHGTLFLTLCQHFVIKKIILPRKKGKITLKGKKERKEKRNGIG